MANRNYPKVVAATTAIPFDNPVTAIPPKTVTGAVTFTKVTTGAQAGYGAVIRVTADGSNVPDLSAFKQIGSGSYDNTNGVVNQLWFIYDGIDYCVAITQPTTISGGGGGLTQLSTPTLTATVISDTEIDLSWTNVSNESSYKLEYSLDGSTGWTQIGGTIAANTTSYNHTGLTTATHYYYRIKAVGDGITYSDSNYGTDDDITSGAALPDSEFTAADGTDIEAYTPDSGGTWTKNAGNWEIQSNRLVTKAPVSGNPITTVDIGVTNFTIQTQGKFMSGHLLQIVFRFTDTNNFVVANVGTTTVDLYNVVSGSASSFASGGVAISNDTDYVFDVVVSGTSVTVKIGGATVCTGTIPTTQSGTRVGVASASGTTAGGVNFNYFKQTA